VQEEGLSGEHVTPFTINMRTDAVVGGVDGWFNLKSRVFIKRLIQAPKITLRSNCLQLLLSAFAFSFCFKLLLSVKLAPLLKGKLPKGMVKGTATSYAKGAPTADDVAKGGDDAAPLVFDATSTFTAPCQVGRCRLPVSKPVLKAPMVSALESVIT